PARHRHAGESPVNEADQPAATVAPVVYCAPNANTVSIGVIVAPFRISSSVGAWLFVWISNKSSMPSPFTSPAATTAITGAARPAFSRQGLIGGVLKSAGA